MPLDHVSVVRPTAAEAKARTRGWGKEVPTASFGLEQGGQEEPVPRQFGDAGAAVVLAGESQPVIAQGAGAPGVQSVRALVALHGRTRAKRFLGQ
ncbi:hypothetical protein ACWHA3_08685 [Streptomyces cyaneofuscatus]|uniref:hypothetical protein n=1 Tax=Streptomyces sp. 021-4 TaxID=2789260 RepID=UPI0039F496F5